MKSHDYWVISGRTIFARNAAAAKRHARASNQVRGSLGSMRARVATQEEIEAYKAEEPARRAKTEADNKAWEARELLNTAAPDLLAALVELTREIEAGGTFKASFATFDRARAAIAKATEGVKS